MGRRISPPGVGTGASGGIGGAIARRLHGQGATVVLSGTRAEALEALAGELGERALVATCNLGDPAETDGLIAKAEAAAGGPLDILVNNAGLTRDGLALRMKDADWQQVLDVNLTAAFRLTRAALKGLCDGPNLACKRRNGHDMTPVGNPIGTGVCRALANLSEL